MGGNDKLKGGPVDQADLPTVVPVEEQPIPMEPAEEFKPVQIVTNGDAPLGEEDVEAASDSVESEVSVVLAAKAAPEKVEYEGRLDEAKEILDEVVTVLADDEGKVAAARVEYGDLMGSIKMIEEDIEDARASLTDSTHPLVKEGTEAAIAQKEEEQRALEVEKDKALAVLYKYVGKVHSFDVALLESRLRTAFKRAEEQLVEERFLAALSSPNLPQGFSHGLHETAIKNMIQGIKTKVTDAAVKGFLERLATDLSDVLSNTDLIINEVTVLGEGNERPMLAFRDAFLAQGELVLMGLVNAVDERANQVVGEMVKGWAEVEEKKKNQARLEARLREFDEAQELRLAQIDLDEAVSQDLHVYRANYLSSLVELADSGRSREGIHAESLVETDKAWAVVRSDGMRGMAGKMLDLFLKSHEREMLLDGSFTEDLLNDLKTQKLESLESFFEFLETYAPDSYGECLEAEKALIDNVINFGKHSVEAKQAMQVALRLRKRVLIDLLRMATDVMECSVEWSDWALNSLYDRVGKKEGASVSDDILARIVTEIDGVSASLNVPVGLGDRGGRTVPAGAALAGIWRDVRAVKRELALGKEQAAEIDALNVQVEQLLQDLAVVEGSFERAYERGLSLDSELQDKSAQLSAAKKEVELARASLSANRSGIAIGLALALGLGFGLGKCHDGEVNLEVPVLKKSVPAEPVSEVPTLQDVLPEPEPEPAPQEDELTVKEGWFSVEGIASVEEAGKFVVMGSSFEDVQPFLQHEDANIFYVKCEEGTTSAIYLHDVSEVNPWQFYGVDEETPCELFGEDGVYAKPLILQ